MMSLFDRSSIGEAHAVFPSSMGLGCASVSAQSDLRDAQGNTIPLHGMRDVEIHLMDMCRCAVTIKETAVSDHISQPILCFGRLLEWAGVLRKTTDFDTWIHFQPKCNREA